MERDQAVLELGTATVETKGPGGVIADGDQGQKLPGLSDE